MGKIIAGYLRTPYQLGGSGKLGIDCSGLVYVIYRDYNSTRLPKNTEKLYRDLKRVDYKNCRYGDLLFFSFDRTQVSHVGIYVGNNKFVHASKSRGVIISSMNEDYYRDNYKEPDGYYGRQRGRITVTFDILDDFPDLERSPVWNIAGFQTDHSF